MRSKWAVPVLLAASLTTGPARAADPPVPFVHSLFSAEFEVYSGGIVGRSVGAAFDSASKGDLGARFSFGFLRVLHFSLDYLYSDQTRSLTSVLPPLPVPPGVVQSGPGKVVLSAANLHVFSGNLELNVIHLPRATFYLSPGAGFARYGARRLTATYPSLIPVSTPIAPGTAPSVNLGAGVKIFPLNHFGVRLEARDFVSGGGRGSLTSGPPFGIASSLCPIQGCPPNPVTFLGPIPIQNNLVFTLGLIFKVL